MFRRARGEDVSFRDVKIKIPDRYWDQGVWMTSCTGSVGWGFLGFEKKQWVEFLPPNETVEIQTWARPDDLVRYGRRALVGLIADDVKAVSIERLCVVFLMSKTFKLKGKVSYLNQFVNFVFSGFLCVVFWLVNTSSNDNKTNHDMWEEIVIFTGKSIYKRERLLVIRT